MSDRMQVASFFLATLGCVFVALIALWQNRRTRENTAGSARFSRAGAFTILAKKIDGVLGPDVEVLMPIGFGRYALALSDFARAQWEKTLTRWVMLDVKLTVIISSPNSEACTYWQGLVDRHSPHLRVALLNRRAATPERAIEIRILDTFHPVLLVRGNQPMGMWIENLHEPDNAAAYNVEYYAASDIVGTQRTRFDRIYKVLRSLTDPNDEPDTVTFLSPATLPKVPARNVA